jgi:hypothetical protein
MNFVRNYLDDARKNEKAFRDILRSLYKEDKDLVYLNDDVPLDKFLRKRKSLFGHLALHGSIKKASPWYSKEYFYGSYAPSWCSN